MSAPCLVQGDCPCPDCDARRSVCECAFCQLWRSSQRRTVVEPTPRKYTRVAGPRADCSKVLVEGRYLRVGDTLVGPEYAIRMRVVRMTSALLAFEYLDGQHKGGVESMTDEDACQCEPLLKRLRRTA